MRAVVKGAQGTTSRMQKRALTFINMGLLLGLSSEAPLSTFERMNHQKQLPQCKS
jgi:hypothetical protein